MRLTQDYETGDGYKFLRGSDKGRKVETTTYNNFTDLMHIASLTVAPRRKILMVLGNGEEEIEKALGKDTELKTELQSFKAAKSQGISGLIKIIEAAEKESRHNDLVN
jgi:hypothetical protein